jgi:hypothetical protein
VRTHAGDANFRACRVSNRGPWLSVTGAELGAEIELRKHEVLPISCKPARYGFTYF